jgi:hypothetical protein
MMEELLTKVKLGVDTLCLKRDKYSKLVIERLEGEKLMSRQVLEDDDLAKFLYNYHND